MTQVLTLTCEWWFERQRMFSFFTFYPPIHLPVLPSIYPFTHPSIHSSLIIYPFTYSSIHPPTIYLSLSIHPSIHPSIHLSIHSPTCPSIIYLSLSIPPSIILHSFAWLSACHLSTHPSASISTPIIYLSTSCPSHTHPSIPHLSIYPFKVWE